VKAADYRTTMTEAQFQQTVTDLAQRVNWLVYHTHDSRRSEPGFPDLVMVRGGRIIFAELKSEKGKLSNPQGVWLVALQDVARYGCTSMHVAVWRPSDLPEIERILR
jgi:VRR-NUC domain